MELRWSRDAFNDLDRLHAFLSPKSQRAADRTVATLLLAPQRLLRTPRIGAAVEGFPNREIRRLIVSGYELRYEVLHEVIRVIRIFHTREDR